jgi:hypothetical protein
MFSGAAVISFAAHAIRCGISEISDAAKSLKALLGGRCTSRGRLRTSCCGVAENETIIAVKGIASGGCGALGRKFATIEPMCKHAFALYIPHY